MIPLRLERGASFGMYVHVPFCARHCPYCDFTVAVVSRVPHEAYGGAVVGEIERRGRAHAGQALRTLYLGGGTPSLWSVGQIGRVVGCVARLWGLPPEVTLEVNPEGVTRERLEAWRGLGVNRLSFGVQSFSAPVLRTLGRAHSPEGAFRAVALALEAGFPHVSVDLMHGVPGQGEAEVEADLRALAALEGVDHVSAYELTWEPRTSFEARRVRGMLSVPEQDAVVTLERLQRAGLGELGFERYEVSSHARAGGRSRHNEGYWSGREVLAVGVGAHGLRVSGGMAVRRANTRSLRRYLEAWSRGELAEPSEEERLTAATHLGERLLTGVRTVSGVDGAALRRRFGEGVVELVPLFERWASRGWGRVFDGGFVPSSRALDHADTLGLDALQHVEARWGGEAFARFGLEQVVDT
ncbi:MAG: radical SAM family heme chaperone HemW [Deltaproteobacteria bacterium]|nr:MAG: radical SAM family heme chaperone HemW [Deltaproteobacteria bacterium]